MLKYEFTNTQEKELAALPISEKEMCARYEKVFTAVCSDILDGYPQYGNQILPYYLRPLQSTYKCAGIAFTIKSISCCVPESREDYYERTVSIFEQFTSNSIAVWDTGVDLGAPTSHYGEMMSTASKLCGCKGAVVDGGVRDIDRIIDLDFKVWARYTTPQGAEQRSRIISWQNDIKIADVVIHPGDVVFADMDGIIVIPREVAYEVLLEAERRQEEEHGWKQMLTSGMGPREFLRAGGSF